MYWFLGEFRAFTLDKALCIEAQALGVNGWVRNLMDGRVEAVFEGEEHCGENAC